MKSVKITATLIYDDELIHGDDPEAKEWFMEELARVGSPRLFLGGDFGDMVGELQNITFES